MKSYNGTADSTKSGSCKTGKSSGSMRVQRNKNNRTEGYKGKGRGGSAGGRTTPKTPY